MLIREDTKKLEQQSLDNNKELTVLGNYGFLNLIFFDLPPKKNTVDTTDTTKIANTSSVETL